MEDADFDVEIKRNIYLVPVAGNIINVLREKPKAEGVTTETFLNFLFQRKIM